MCPIQTGNKEYGSWVYDLDNTRLITRLWQSTNIKENMSNVDKHGAHSMKFAQHLLDVLSKPMVYTVSLCCLSYVAFAIVAFSRNQVVT